MSSRVLRPIDRTGKGWEARLVNTIDSVFEAIRRRYNRMLTGALSSLPVVLTFAVIILCSIYFLASGSKSVLAPMEDQGVVLAEQTSPGDATTDQRALWDNEVSKIMLANHATTSVFQIDMPGTEIAGDVLKPWDQRNETATALQKIYQKKFNTDVAGQQVVAFQLPPLPGSSGLPIQFAITTTASYDQLAGVANQVLQAAYKTGKFVYLETDLKIDQPQSTVVIDRSKAADLGLTMNAVGATLGEALGGNYVNYFNLDNRSYQVISEVQRTARLTPNQLSDYSVDNINGIPVPLSSIATIRNSVVPESINHFQQQNSATLEGVAAPGVSMGEATATLDKIAANILPPGYTVGYGGQMRQFVQNNSGFLVTFLFSLIIIYLSLAALFNSFRDPFIILVSVPMSIAGAMIFIYLGFGGVSLNIYTEVGLVTLMGLISKHGILMVEVANEAQRSGMPKREAIVHAANIRLRPILMTTSAMVLGVVPLIIATGAGAAARINMGVVIAAGLTIGTMFTLFVVPSVYLVLSGRHLAAEGHLDA